jgi:predicted nucleotidyltransferase
MTIFERIRALNLPVGSYVVGGSGVLEALGIRKVGDLDVLVSKGLFESFAQAGMKEDETFFNKYGRRTIKISESVEIYNDFVAGKYRFEPEELIERAVMIEGVPFISVEDLLMYKRELNREKDFKDIELIEKYLTSKK